MARGLTPYMSLVADDGRVVAPRLRVANSFLSKFRGLMGVASLAEGEGLYLPGTNSIHMLFMRFPIDCVFVGGEDSEGWRRVVGLRESLPAWRGVVWYVRGARGVAELRAGTVAGAGLRMGDRVHLGEAGP